MDKRIKLVIEQMSSFYKTEKTENFKNMVFEAFLTDGPIKIIYRMLIVKGNHQQKSQFSLLNSRR